jgi:NAD(P)-dependent dehydrogenase (short-subunit alcohol dehydrogenase family)
MAKQYWNNKVVLITGGSSGIGLAAAKQLAAAGSHVWLVARRLELLEPALKEVQAARRESPNQVMYRTYRRKFSSG